MRTAHIHSTTKTTMKQESVENIPTVRILLLGNAGVGKSRLVNLLAKSKDTPTKSTRSVGDYWWNVQVRLHEYACYKDWMPPTPEWTSSSSPSTSTNSTEQRTLSTTAAACEMIPHFVEFYDLKSSLRIPREHRNRLYRHIDGIILVYDLLNMSTHDKLHDWLYQPLRQICRYRHKRLRPILKRRHVPILVVGTKLDLLTTRQLQCSGKISNQLGAQEILVDCLDSNSFAEKSRNESKLRKFLNSAVEFQQYFPSRRH